MLHALDILCHAFRCLMRDVNLSGGDLFAYQNYNLMTHDRITDSQSWMIDPSRLLERLFVGRYSVGQSRTLRDTFSNMNCAFFQTRTEGEKSFGGQHFHGSPLHNHLVRIGEIEATPLNLEIVKQLRDWASDSIHMNEDVRSELGLPKAPKGRRNAK
ncbi:hypothetical protein [Methylobacterium aquaticum]|uniref:hypothetical protein n=1 Tax=Methylobacterium aquaticum TaxID=270351 RepID=UPI0019317A01|nr:hypothetical protein [Methylobacterium aquaticum]QRE75510.1 hypothetical protein F1D61_19690 [Methylobacterium aquaticum]